MSDHLAHTQSDDRTVSRGGSDGWRILPLGAVVASLVSAVGSVVGYGLLPVRMRIHWSLGGPYYGPEFAPTLVVLTAFSVLIAGVALGAYWGDARLRTMGAVDDGRPYVVAMLGTLGLLLVVQAVLIAANL